MPVIETLRIVAAAMEAADDPWWIIGSAAVSLHGGRAKVADIDVLTSAAGARRLCGLWERLTSPPHPDERFRSAVYERFDHAPEPIEIMGGLAVWQDGRWSAVALVTREAVTIDGVVVFVPSRTELRALLRRFGRAKDLRRAALL